MGFYDNIIEADLGLIKRGVQNRQWLLRAETEDFLRAECEHYEAQQERWWQRDYSSEQAYWHSVEPNRQRWLQAIGDFGPPEEHMLPELEPFIENDRIIGHWVTIRLFGGLRGRAVLALPKQRTGPVPLVIAQHGIGSSPERAFGFDDEEDLYRSYGQRLVEAGFAVLAPMNITEGPPRARYTRMCIMLGKTLWGLEIAKIRRLLDWALAQEGVDAERVGMWGISLGGAYTSFTTPLEPRIKAAIICAWFNHRVKKMVIDDPRYSCFLSTTEEHIFIPGWLREFTDSDLASLICPRPMLVETGKGDGISWWPQVQEEFKAAMEHYIGLGIGERIEMDLHEGGHEIRLVRSLEFLKKWLM